ncbi:MAG: C1 family peptidase [Bdellovibrionales bacterium]
MKQKSNALIIANKILPMIFLITVQNFAQGSSLPSTQNVTLSATPELTLAPQNPLQKTTCPQLLLKVKNQNCYGACWAMATTSMLEGLSKINKYHIPEHTVSGDALFVRYLQQQVLYNLDAGLDTSIDYLLYFLKNRNFKQESNTPDALSLLLQFGATDENDYTLPKNRTSFSKSAVLSYLNTRLAKYYQTLIDLIKDFNKHRTESSRIQQIFEEVYSSAADDMFSAITAYFGELPSKTYNIQDLLENKKIYQIEVNKDYSLPKNKFLNLFLKTRDHDIFYYLDSSDYKSTIHFPFKKPEKYLKNQNEALRAETFSSDRLMMQKNYNLHDAHRALLHNAKNNVPTVMSISWLNKFENRNLGTLALNNKKPIKLSLNNLMLHAVLVVGVNTKIENNEEVIEAVTIQNSWGEYVGKNGFYQIDANYLNNYLHDLTWLQDL